VSFRSKTRPLILKKGAASSAPSASKATFEHVLSAILQRIRNPGFPKGLDREKDGKTAGKSWIFLEYAKRGG